ncbi:MAG: GTPase Era [Alphaproteobacteria bacterium]
MSEPETPTRCGYVAVIGAPNAGKSTLTNQIVGAKISIVTPKVQTTRGRVTAIAMVDRAQLVFVDTPGIFAPKRRLDRAMVEAAWVGARDADQVVAMIDATQGLDRQASAILEALAQINGRKILALNKVDLVKPAMLLALSEAANKQAGFNATFMISALAGDGVADLAADLARHAPEGPWLYPEDQLADMPERLLASEVTREKLFLQLQQELPYALTVETESWEERPDGAVKINQVIYVGRDSQKAIVLGHKGARIKQIGQASRIELAEFLGRPVHLFLFVKVRPNWSDDPERYRAMGLDYTD